MEWSKIKNILIVALILIDLLFLYLLLQPSGTEGETGQDAQILQDTLTVLQDNGITVRADTDFSEMQLPMLTLTFDEDNGTYNYVPRGERISLSQETALDAAGRFLAEMGGFGNFGTDIRVESVKMSGTDPQQYTVSYSGYYEDYRIRDLYVRCTVGPAGVVRMEKQWGEAAEANRNGRPLIPVTSALLRYMDKAAEEDPGEARTVTDISVAYTVDTPYDGTVTSDTAFPAWRIEASDGSVVYIPAYRQ